MTSIGSYIPEISDLKGFKLDKNRSVILIFHEDIDDFPGGIVFIIHDRS